ncbi:uncharacterized protein DS421_17g582300 [Arachis hypogaea]|nr:uncharacterized protein DS421_17g582300 [Arachis hypogaea]
MRVSGETTTVMSGGGGQRSNDDKSSEATMVSGEGEIDIGEGTGGMNNIGAERSLGRNWCSGKGKRRYSSASHRLSPATTVSNGRGRERNWRGRRKRGYGRIKSNCA